MAVMTKQGIMTEARLAVHFCVVSLLIYHVTGQTLTLEPTSDPTVCINTTVQFTCNVTGSIALVWRNSNGDSAAFSTSSLITDTQPLGPFTASVNSMSNPLSSTVTLNNVASSDSVLCNDGGTLFSTRSFTIQDRISALNVSKFEYSEGSIRVSWSPPSDEPNCCEVYVVELCGKTSLTTNTFMTLDLPIETICQVCVHCRDGGGRDGVQTCSSISTKPRFSVSLTDTGIITITEENNVVASRPEIVRNVSICSCDADGLNYYNVSTGICDFPPTCIMRCVNVTLINEVGSNSRERFCLPGTPTTPPPATSPTPTQPPPPPISLIALITITAVLAVVLAIAVIVVSVLYCYDKDKLDTLLQIISRTRDWITEQKNINPLPHYKLVPVKSGEMAAVSKHEEANADL